MTPSELAERLGKLLIVGGGHMGEAILSGLLNAGAISRDSVVVANPGAEKRKRLGETYGVDCIASATECGSADTCILAVKPQVIENVMLEIHRSGLSPKRVISVAAGTKTASIAPYFPDSGVVRTMPNIPLVHGCGVTGISGGVGTPEADVLLARDMFGCMGKAEVVDESLQDAVVAVSGSGPAYFAMFVEAVAKAGESLGLDYETALEMALHTMIGAGKVMEAEGISPGDLVERLCTPGGTTYAAISAMREAGVEDDIAAGMRAAFDRSKELS